MLFRLFLLFTVIPLIELWLLLRISDLMNVLFTILLVITTGIIGASLARQQGWKTWRRIQEQAARGQPPTDSLLDALLILIAGAVLITPGILTDIVGFTLLMPAARVPVKSWLTRRFQAKIVASIHTAGSPQRSAPPSTGDGSVIDAEFTRHPTNSSEGE